MLVPLRDSAGCECSMTQIAHDAFEWPQVPTLPSDFGSFAAHSMVSCPSSTSKVSFLSTHIHRYSPSDA